MNSRIKKFYSSKKNRFLSKKYSASNKKTIGTNKDNNTSRSKRKKYISKVKSSNFSTKKLFRKGIIFSNKKDFSSIPVAYIVGFLITFLLLITSSVDAILSDSLFIIYSGILLIKLPKIYSKGKIMDYTILFFLLFNLLFFLANSYWGTSFTSQGNEIIYSYFEPFYLFSNVSNLIITFSLVAIYYSMNSWSNDSHQKNRLFMLFFILSFFSILICYNNISNPLGFLFRNNDNLHQIDFYLENFTLYSTLIGVLGYGHWILSKCKEKIFSLISFILSFLVFYNNPSFFLLLVYAVFCSGFTLLAILRSKIYYSKKVFLFSLSFILLLFLMYHNDLFSLEVYKSKFSLIEKFVTRFSYLISHLLNSNHYLGFGPATFNYLIPQIKDSFELQDNLYFRGSNLLVLIFEFGFLGLFLVGFTLSRWYKENANFYIKDNDILRKIFYFVTLIFLIRFLFIFENIGIGLVFLSILLLHLATFENLQKRILLSAYYVRAIGCFFVFIGVFYIFSIFNDFPVHPGIRYNIFNKVKDNGENVDFDLIPKLDQNSLLLELKKAVQEKKDSLKIREILNRIRIFQPHNNAIDYKVGYILLDHNIDLALDYFYRFYCKDSASKKFSYKNLLYHMSYQYEDYLKCNKLSQINPYYRINYLFLLKREDLLTELNFQPLDFGLLDNDLKFSFIERLINIGCFDISNKFVKQLDKDTEYIWWLDALKLKEKADFEGAIKIIELNLNKVPIPYSNKLSEENIYLRPFLSKEADIKMGSYLLSKALSEKNLIQASKIIDHLMDLEPPPLFVYYWKAKILYMQGYFVETWFAYESYINKLKLRNNKIILN